MVEKILENEEKIHAQNFEEKKKQLWDKYILKIPVSKECVCNKINGEILLSVQVKELSLCRI